MCLVPSCLSLLVCCIILLPRVCLGMVHPSFPLSLSLCSFGWLCCAPTAGCVFVVKPTILSKKTSISAIVCAETLSCSVCEAMHVSAECVTQSLWVITIHFAFCQSGSVSEAFPAVRSEWKGCILTRCVALVMRSSQLKCGQPGLRLLLSNEKALGSVWHHTSKVVIGEAASRLSFSKTILEEKKVSFAT